MTAYYADDWLTVYQGDCREVMASMEPESVHCVVTSPPYWGLRDYGTATWVGGNSECDHQRPTARKAHERRASTLGGGVATVAAQDAGVNAETVCGRCGAQRQDSQLGLEPTPEDYVANMVAVFREVRRVLRADGTVWLNLGDSYASSPPGNTKTGPEKWASSGLHGGVSPVYAATLDASVGTRRSTVAPGLKPKDLVGIPWRVAFALQADGWYLRSDIIWAKPNPMPESVTDRPTKSHEYLFLLSKSARYYYDAKSVAEPAEYSGPNGPQHSPYGQGFTRRSDKQAETVALAGIGNGHHVAGFNDRWDAKERATWAERKAAGAHPGSHGGGALVGTGTQRSVHGEGMSHDLGSGLSRNLRSVWTVATQPYPGAHFATFPEKLIEPCIKAGSPHLGTGTGSLCG
jgi:site-specific DNA-methyltransferase (cytosine-N4-specific)